MIDGKTGPRKIGLLKSILYLHKWMETHPQNDNSDASVMDSS